MEDGDQRDDAGLVGYVEGEGDGGVGEEGFSGARVAREVVGRRVPGEGGEVVGDEVVLEEGGGEVCFGVEDVVVAEGGGAGGRGEEGEEAGGAGLRGVLVWALGGGEGGVTWVSRSLVLVASGNQGRVSRIHWKIWGEVIFWWVSGGWFV